MFTHWLTVLQVGAALALHAAACVADCQDLPGKASSYEQMGRADFAAQALIYRAAELEVITHLSSPPRASHCRVGRLNPFLYAFILFQDQIAVRLKVCPLPTSMQMPPFSLLCRALWLCTKHWILSQPLLLRWSKHLQLRCACSAWDCSWGCSCMESSMYYCPVSASLRALLPSHGRLLLLLLELSLSAITPEPAAATAAGCSLPLQ